MAGSPNAATRVIAAFPGYIYLENGEEVYFDGEWTGDGEVEGYDEDGNYYTLEVD